MAGDHAVRDEALGSDLKPYLAVIGAAVLFGATFVVVKDAIEDVDPYAFIAVRFAIGSLVLAPIAARRPKAPGLAGAALIAGLALVAGYVFQTVGLQYTTGSVSAFLTYLLVVFVPLLAWVMTGHRPPLRSLLAVAVCTGGLLLLTGGPKGIGRGELLTLGCAIAFAAHVLALSRYAPRHDAIRLNTAQLAVVAVVCAAPGALGGGYHFTWPALAAAAFCGIAASAIALGLQTWAQSRLPPLRVSLLLLIEPITAAILGIFAGDGLGLIAALGCAVILAGIVLGETGAEPD